MWNIHNFSEVVWKTLCALDPERDVQFVLVRPTTLDHAARDAGLRVKDGIDATRKWATEGFARPCRMKFSWTANESKIDAIWKSLDCERGGGPG